MLKHLLIAGCALATLLPAGVASQTVDQILSSYIQAVGGLPAIDRISSREIHAKLRHGPKLVYFWQKPNKVLLEKGKEKFGYDGGSGWTLSKKKHVSKLSKGLEEPLLLDANPLRYAHLKQLFSDLDTAPPQTIEGRPMNIIVAPNNIGETKLYFDAATHLLVHIEETGKTSAYFKHSTDFSDYQEHDGVRLPLAIVHTSTEPGVGREQLQISQIEQNVPLPADLFNRPRTAAVVLGGKR